MTAAPLLETSAPPLEATADRVEEQWHPWLVRVAELCIVGVGVVLAAMLGFAATAAPIVLAGALVTIVGALLALQRPAIATLAVVALLYSNAAVVAVKFNGAPFVVGASVPLLLLLPLAYHIIARQEPIVLTRYLKPLLILLTAHLLATIMAEPGGDQIRWFVTFVVEGAGLFFLIVNVVRTRDILDRVLVTLVFVAGAMGGLSLFQQLTSTFSFDYFGFAQVNESLVSLTAFDYAYLAEGEKVTGQPRLAGPIGEKNFYAFILAAVWPFSFVIARHHRNSAIRLLAGVCTVTIAAGVVLSFSRGAAVAVGGAVVILSCLGVLSRRLAPAAAALGVAVVLLTPGYAERIVSLANVTAVTDQRASSNAEADEALRGRFSEMLSAAYVAADHPLVGVGPGQFRHRYLDYAARLGFAGIHDEPREAHNLYLGLAADVGLIGMGAFVVFLGRLIGDVHRRWRRPLDRAEQALSAAVLVSLTTFAISNMFLHMAFARYGWLLLAVAATHVEVTKPGRPR